MNSLQDVQSILNRLNKFETAVKLLIDKEKTINNIEKILELWNDLKEPICDLESQKMELILHGQVIHSQYVEQKIKCLETILQLISSF